MSMTKMTVATAIAGLTKAINNLDKVIQQSSRDIEKAEAIIKQKEDTIKASSEELERAEAISEKIKELIST